MPAVGLIGGRYRLEDTIGQGGMGVVYRAIDTTVRRPVAVKTIRGQVDEPSLEQFRRESEALAGLSHSNIIDIYDVGEFTDKDGKRPYFVMPLLRGSNLADLLHRSDCRVDPERLVDIVSQACRGLQAAHNRNLIHRDLKPSNLFVLEDDSVKIIDFGIVHLAGKDSEAAMKGTLYYMAPEQLDGRPVPQSDIFSLAVVCYEAFTGRKPFDGKTVAEVMAAIRTHTPPAIPDLNVYVPYPLAKVVHRALAKQPYYRFSSARDFSDALQRALRSEPIAQLDRARIAPRLSQIKKALSEGDARYAKELLEEVDAEGYIDAEIATLRIQIESAARTKTVHQLLESARARVEEEDYPLALEKVRNALAVDPDNIDALALKRQIEQQHSTAGIEKWYQIARQHLDNKHFVKAREAAEEILKLDPAHKRAKDLKDEIRRGEQEQRKIRQEIHQLYESALRAYANGEISTAIGKLGRVIELGKHASSNSQSDSQYVSMYNQLVQERDELQASYAEGRKALESRNFTRANEICKQALDRRPRDPLFQALKIAVDQGERQARSAAIAEIHSRIEAEPDLEKKLQLAKQAVTRFPDEPTFGERLKSLKEERELVNGLVARARHYESQGQFAEARNQWDVLRTIHPLYPGLDYELDRLSRCQQESLQGQARTECLERIDRAFVSANYEDAGKLLETALAEFPEDEQVLQRKRELESAIEVRDRAHALVVEAEQLRDGGDRVHAIACFREARELDPDCASTRQALLATLVEHARTLVETDWRAALPFCDEARELDSDSPLVADISSLIENASRRKALPRVHVAAVGAEAAAPPAPETPASAEVPALASSFLGTESVDRTRLSPDWMNSQYATGENTSAAERVSSGDRLFLHRQLPPEKGRLSTLVKPTYVVVGAAVLLVALATLWLQIRHRRNAVEVRPPAPVSVKPVRREAPGKLVSDGPIRPLTGTSSEPRKGPPATTAAVTHGSEPQPSQSSWVFSVHFTTDPEVAEVTVDDNDHLTCLTPCELKLSRGEHNIVVSKGNRPDVLKTIVLPGDENTFIPLPDELTEVHIVSGKSLNIAIDGEDHGPPPLTLFLRPGTHRLLITSGGVERLQTFEVLKQDDGGPQIINVDGQTAQANPQLGARN